MDNTKKIVLIFMMGVSALCASDVQNRMDFKAVYNQLLTKEGKTEPKNADQSLFNFLLRPNYSSLFDKAKETGLVAQYKRLLTSQVAEYAGLVEAFINSSNLAVIAFLQNVYGNGNPFAYNPDNAVATRLSYDPVLGNYIAPGPREVTITVYSFFNGLLDAFVALRNDPAMRGNSYFNMLCDRLTNGLAAATKDENSLVINKFHELVKKAEILIDQGNTDAIMELSNVNVDLEKIINKYLAK